LGTDDPAPVHKKRMGIPIRKKIDKKEFRHATFYRDVRLRRCAIGKVPSTLDLQAKFKENVLYARFMPLYNVEVA
jgi:hypothetical protein